LTLTDTAVTVHDIELFGGYCVRRQITAVSTLAR